MARRLFGPVALLPAALGVLVVWHVLLVRRRGVVPPRIDTANDFVLTPLANSPQTADVTAALTTCKAATADQQNACTGACSDALIWSLMAVLTLAFALVPFIPGVRPVPRYVPVCTGSSGATTTGGDTNAESTTGVRGRAGP